MITDYLKRDIAVIGIVHIITIVFALIFFTILLIKARRDYAVKAFLVMQASAIFWMVFKIFKTVSPNETLRWTFIVAYYFCICLFEVTFFEFAFAYYKNRPPKKHFRIALYALATSQFLAVLTNPWHHLFYSEYDFWSDSFGILFYVHTAIAYSLLIVGVVYCSLTFRRHFASSPRWYKNIMAFMFLLPLIINFLYISKRIEKIMNFLGIPFHFDTDITPIVFIIATSAFLYATFKNQLIDISPIMRHEIFHRLNTAICVLNGDFQVVYGNQKAFEAFGENAKQTINSAIERLNIDDALNKSCELTINDEVYDVFMRRVDDITKKQYIVRFNNITDYKVIQRDLLVEQEALTETNRELQLIIEELKKNSRIGARNYVARELHDIIGHSLVVAIKTLEVAKLYHDIDRQSSQRALDDSTLALQRGIGSIGKYNSRETQLFGALLQSDLQDTLRRVESTTIKTKFSFKGAHILLEGEVYDAINRICLELTTNSIKHAKAKTLFLSVALDQSNIDILYMDDGVGCPNLVHGNGLRGIAKRLSRINGEAHFVTEAGEGFTAKIKIATV